MLFITNFVTFFEFLLYFLLYLDSFELIMWIVRWIILRSSFEHWHLFYSNRWYETWTFQLRWGRCRSDNKFSEGSNCSISNIMSFKVRWFWIIYIYLFQSLSTFNSTFFFFQVGFNPTSAYIRCACAHSETSTLALRAHLRRCALLHHHHHYNKKIRKKNRPCQGSNLHAKSLSDLKSKALTTWPPSQVWD